MRAKIIILASSTLVLWSYQIYQEMIQIKFLYEDGSLKKYFTSLMNIADISCLMMTLALCLTNYGDTPSMGLETQAYMGAFVSFFLFNKCFDWLRVFEETAFLIQLIKATILDIGPFMVLFLAALIMFALPLTILDNINRLEGEDSSLIGDLTGFGPVDAILKEYQDVLAGFEPKSFYETQPMMSVMTITIFLCATFFTQITMLNMLIAIMGDTFGKITDQRTLYATRTKLALLADYAANIRTAPKPDDLAKKFLFVVEPEAEEEGFDESWQGTVHKLQKHMNLLYNKNAKKFDLLDKKIDDKIMDLDAGMNVIKTDMNEKNGLVSTNIKSVEVNLKSDVSSI